MKKKGIILGILGAVLLTVLTGVALLPAIVSSERMRPSILQTINRQIPGELQVKAWSLGWFGRIDIQGIVYNNRRDGLLARVAEFKTNSGILGLILGRGDLGRRTMEKTEGSGGYCLIPLGFLAFCGENTTFMISDNQNSRPH